MARTARGALLVGTCVVFAIPSLAFAGCSSKSEETTETTGGPAAEPAAMFRAVLPELVKTCGGEGGSCHVRGSLAPHWLGDPDAYAAAKRYPGILPATHEPGDSILLTQVDHAGPSLKRYAGLYDKVAAWITAELPAPPLPSTAAFSVVEGFNVVSLHAIGSGLDGARLTFLATEPSIGTLLLTAIRVQAPQNATLLIDSPFFVILPRDGKVKAEPTVNGFAGELSVPAGTTADLYAAKMILTGWDRTGRLKITFRKLESAPDHGASPNCTALDVFQNKAAPAMQIALDITGDDDNDGGTFDASVVGKGSCFGCHGATPAPNEAPSTAVQALDLRGLETNPAAACALARLHVNFQDKAQSLILLNPTGKGNPHHPIKPLADDHPIVEGLRAWVTAETP